MNSQTINLYLKKNCLILSLIFIFIISRLLIFNFDIKPDPKWINLMQHINLKLLKEDLLGSIFYFHSQPPMWNFIIGIGVKFFGANSIKISYFILFINLLSSISIIFISIKTLELIKINKTKIFFLILILIILSPSIIFYENFLSYAHFTCLNIFLIKYYLIKLYKNYKFKYEIKIYLFVSILVLTWSAYTILFLIVIFSLILPKTYLNFKKRSITLFIIFIILGNLPAIKNKVYFDFFTNSTWLGIQASQSLGYDRVEWTICSYDLGNVKLYNHNFRIENQNKKKLDHPMLNDGRYNDLGFLYRSKYCASKINNHFFKNFKKLLFEKLNRFLSVHGHLSFDYLFKPLAWTKNFSYLEFLNLNQFFKINVFIFFMTIYTIFFILFIQSILKKNKDFIDFFIIANSFLYAYLILISFFGGSWEQERMRYTEFSFIFYSIPIILKKLRIFNN